MTKLRDPLSACATVELVGTMLGYDVLSGLLNRSARTIRHWSDPDVVANIRFDKAVELDREFLRQGGDFAPFLSLFHAHVTMGEPDLIGCNTARAERAADAAEEAGEAIASQIRAYLPGATAADVAEAHRDTAEAIVALARTLPDLQPRIAA
jgi:hypothetical protein